MSSGLTLVEVLIGAVILLVTMLAIAAALSQHLRLVEINRERTMALNAAQGLLEAELNRDFAQLISPPASGGYGVVDGGTVSQPLPLAAGSFLPNLPFTAKGQVRVQDVDGQPNAVRVVEVRVVVCWRSQGRVIGEDVNLNGVLDAGEDQGTANGLIDSPAVVATRLARTKN